MKKWTLNQGLIKVTITKHKLVFMGNSTQKFVVPKTEENLINFMGSGHWSEKEIRNWMRLNDHTWSFEKLIESGILTEYYTDKDDIHSREAVYFDLFTECKMFKDEIKKKRILVIGVDDVAGQIINSFSRMGIKEIVILGDGIVDEFSAKTNILFNKNDIGKKKTEAIKENISNFSNTIITSIGQFEITKQLLDEIRKKYELDFVILAASSGSRLNWFCYEIFSLNNIPFTTCLYTNTILMMGPILDRKNQNYETIMSTIPKELQVESKYKNTIESLSQIQNSYLAAFTSNDILRYWTRKYKPETYEVKIQFDFITLGKQKFSL